MAESQNTEYKELWKDDYLKWICGFANAQGGTLYIGIDDNGKVVGIKNIKKILEDLPNKISSGLGIVTEINSRKKDSLDYIEINVPKSITPVSYHGEFYFRSGATNQKLTGMAMVNFIARKTGVIWEDGLVDNITVEDLDDVSFKIFRREALAKKRIDEEELKLSNQELLEKLNLISEGKLKRSAILLFYKKPSVVQTGSIVQVGKFFDGPEILYQDIYDGSLISTADRIVDDIYLKYLKAKITFEHDRRYETYPYPRAAVREAIFNALVHNCYMFGAPIQIRIDEKEMMISNTCMLPENWTVDNLLSKHQSIPYNPTLANTFYIAGYIEHWGRGIEKILKSCHEFGAKPPEYKICGNTISITFKALESAIIKESYEVVNKDDVLNGGLNSGLNGGLNGGLNATLSEQIIQQIKTNNMVTIPQIANLLGIPQRTIEREIKKLRNESLISREGSKKKGRWIIK